MLSLILVLAMLISACGAPAAAPAPAATASTGCHRSSSRAPKRPLAAGSNMICVIVPPVENPFFGAMQQIAADKAEELGYTTLRLNHGDDANKQMELFESCIAQKRSRHHSGQRRR